MSGGVFSPDRRFLAYNALLLLLLYWAFRKCMSLIGSWPCDSPVGCSSAVEWIATAAGAAQAMVSIAVAVVYRQSSTAGLLNSIYDLLSRGGAAETRGEKRRSHLIIGGTYAAAAIAVVLARSSAVVLARPSRFSASDVLLLYVPVSVVPIAVECAIVCVCSVAENACHEVVDRLNSLATSVAKVDQCSTSLARAKLRHRSVHRQLEIIWRQYWRGCRLVERLSQCYGLDLTVNLTANMLFFIVYAYFTLMSVYMSSTRDTGTDSSMAANATTIGDVDDAVATIYWNVALLCQLVCVSFRIVFISYRAEKIKQVVIIAVVIAVILTQ